MWTRDEQPIPLHSVDLEHIDAGGFRVGNSLPHHQHLQHMALWVFMCCEPFSSIPLSNLCGGVGKCSEAGLYAAIQEYVLGAHIQSYYIVVPQIPWGSANTQ